MPHTCLFCWFVEVLFVLLVIVQTTTFFVLFLCAAILLFWMLISIQLTLARQDWTWGRVGVEVEVVCGWFWC